MKYIEKKDSKNLHVTSVSKKHRAALWFRRIQNGQTGFLFVLVLLVLLGSVLLLGHRTYSDTEKRQLQTCPKPTVGTIKDGTFQKKFENYFRDQFPQRDEWVKLETTIKRGTGKKEINGVYFGKDHYLLEKYSKEDFPKKQQKKNLKALAHFVKEAENYGNVRIMMVPTKSWVLREKLPAFAPEYDEQQFYDALLASLKNAVSDGTAQRIWVPVDSVLKKHKKEDIYYRTDHHWTTLGAWYGYEAYVRSIGGDVADAAKKKRLQSVSTDFYGTTYAKVNQASQADTIWVYQPQTSLKVVYNMGQKTTTSLYDRSFLKTQDQYSVFTGGNQAVLEITGGQKNGKTLLLIKDSFANCMLPFLAEDYEKLVVVDLRQLNVKGSMLLEMFSPTDILILYNSAQFVQDKEVAIKLAV